LNTSIKSTIALFLFIATMIGGCDSALFDKRINEGIIEYEITYPKLDPNNVMADFMPDKMTMTFKDNVLLNEIAAGWGTFKTQLIANSNDYSFMQLVKLFSKKSATVLDKNAMDDYNKDYPEFLITYFDETKVIAGYNCKKALVIYTDVSLPYFYAYYTDEIRFKDPNWSVPFSEFDGVLLEYEMENYGILMHFIATSVTDAHVDDEVFALPDDYGRVTFKEMQEQMDELFSSFQ